MIFVNEQQQQVWKLKENGVKKKLMKTKYVKI